MDITNIAITSKIAASFAKTVNTIEAKASITMQQATTLTDGNGANNADILYYDDTVSIAASSTATFDLAGVLTDVFGDTITMAKVKAIFVRHKSTSAASSIDVGGNGGGAPLPLFAAAGDQVLLTPGGSFLVENPTANGLCAVTGGTADELEIQNNDGSNAADIEILIVGSTA